MPTISAYIIGRNCAHTLGAAIESILEQTHPVDEIWYVDDASEDDSRLVAGAYTERGVKILANCAHLGIHASRNRAVDACTADWVGVLDADDVWLPHKIEMQLTRIAGCPTLKVVGGFAEIVDAAGDRLGVITCPVTDAAIKSRELIHNCFVHSTVLFERALFHAVGGYRAFDLSQDYDLLVRMSEHGRLANIPKPLAVHRISYQSQSLARWKVQMRCARQVKAQAWLRRGGAPPLRVRAVAAVRSAIAPLLLRSPYVHWGVHQLVHGEFEQGRALLQKDIRTSGRGAWVARLAQACPDGVYKLGGRLLGVRPGRGA